MSEMLLLDKRTQSLIEDYVPQGDILEGVVCFFSVFAMRITVLPFPSAGILSSIHSFEAYNTLK